MGLCPRIAQLFVPHIVYHLTCSLMAYIAYSNSRYFLRQEKCKLIGNEFASISIQVGRIRWIKSCWENESTPRERIGAGQVNGCPKPATSMRLSQANRVWRKNTQPAGFRNALQHVECFPNIFARGQPEPDRIARFGFPACSLPLGHTKTDEHDRRNGPQRT